MTTESGRAGWEEFALAIHRIGAVKFGEFTLKSGQLSPVYVDLRGLVSHPDVLRLAGQVLLDALEGLEYDLIAGLPYAGLPLAVSASLAGDLPLIYPRKESKEYGTRRRVEGEFRAGQRVAVLDDVITNGGAKIELIEPLRAEGLVVTDVLVLVDREQGGAETLREHGLTLHRVCTLRQVVEALRSRNAIDERQAVVVLEYLGR
jgi:uridine monophosphate synthetase